MLQPRQPDGVEDGLPPHAPDAERALLGCVMEDSACVEDVRERIRAWGSMVFYDLRHKHVWDSIVELHARGTAVDLITVSQELLDAGHLDQVGGAAFLNEIAQSVTSPSNWPYYLDIIVEKFLARRVMATAASALSRLQQDPGRVREFVTAYQEQVITLVEEHSPSVVLTQQERMDRLIDSLERRHRGKQEITGLPTPFWYLNNMTAGLQPKELMVVAARPSCGKTAFGIDLSIHTLRQKKRVAFFSLEMGADQIDMRMFGAVARVNGMKLRNGFWRQDAEERMQAAIHEMAGWDLYLDDRSSLSGQDVLLTCRRLRRERPVGLVVVDYIQLMLGAKSYDQRHQELAEASRLLKQTAKESGCPVVVLAQLNRDAEKDRGGRKPLLSDIKDCGSIEQDADVVGLLWEPKIDENDPADMKWLENFPDPDDPKEDETSWQQWFRRINLSIGKNRNGPTGDCELVFQRSTARFCDAHSPQRVKQNQGQMI